jgi:hypothetical protein
VVEIKKAFYASLSGIEYLILSHFFLILGEMLNITGWLCIACKIKK